MEPHQVFQYCPTCQQQVSGFAGNKFECAKCGLVHYINSIPCCGLLLLNDKNELLLVERRNDPKGGLWDIPGGFLELNETIEEATVRETREETGIQFKCTDLTYFGSVASRYLYKNVKDHILVMIFSATLPQGEIVEAGDDAKSAKFFPLDRIPWDRIAFSGVAEQIAKFIKLFP